jgi:1-acyl-sn-glycerol-3-phosphate acyltransferase
MQLPSFPDVRARVDRLEIPFDDLNLDPFGVRKEDVAFFMSTLKPFYFRYFRVKVEGLHHIPPRGRAMLVGNHSGGWAVDAFMIVASCFFGLEPPRLVQGMADKFMSRVPFLSSYMARTGNFAGLPENAERLLDNDRLLMVFPEGARGTAKLYWERKSLLEFGTGFMRLALKTRTPIIPLGFVGGGDAIPTVANLYRLGKRLGVPYVPVTPYGLAIPRPVPLEVYYGPPLHFQGTGNEEDSKIYDMVDRVKRAIRDLMDRGESQRRIRSGRRA